MSKVSVSSQPYVTSHGRTPSGRGMWGFCPADKWNTNEYLDHVMWFNDTFSEARQQAKARAAELGITRLVVCS